MSITKGEEILLVGLQNVARQLGSVHDERYEIIQRASALIDATLNMFEKEGMDKSGEAMLLEGLRELDTKITDAKRYLIADYDDELDSAISLIKALLNAHAARQFPTTGAYAGKPVGNPVQFNPGVYGEKRPLDWHEEGFKAFHPMVRGTSYMEVHELIGTSGCSPEEPYWTWTVCGVIETKRGKLLVCPNDWILEPYEGHFIVLPDSVYRSSKKEPDSGNQV